MTRVLLLCGLVSLSSALAHDFELPRTPFCFRPYLRPVSHEALPDTIEIEVTASEIRTFAGPREGLFEVDEVKSWTKDSLLFTAHTPQGTAYLINLTRLRSGDFKLTLIDGVGNDAVILATHFCARSAGARR